MNDLQRRLVELLHSIAMYNDKGAMWSHDSHQQSQNKRAAWRQEIDGLIATIGEQNFSPQLLAELRRPVVLDDPTGVYAEKVLDWFAQVASPKDESAAHCSIIIAQQENLRLRGGFKSESCLKCLT